MKFRDIYPSKTLCVVLLCILVTAN